MAPVDPARSPGGGNDGTAPYQGWPASAQTPPRKRKHKARRHFAGTPGISITSLTDMVTMLLVYLLKTFATNPVEVKDSSIEVPRSLCLPNDKQRTDVPPADGCGVEWQERPIAGWR